MRVHHLNCGTLCPPGGALLHERGHLVCHVLLIESSDGLALVDTGLGTADCDSTTTRLNRGFRALLRPRLSRAETALAQVEQLGFDAEDVRHILVTHLDLDHAGGLSDFPHARVHLYQPELEAARNPTWRERMRYAGGQWAHGPAWAVQRPKAGGERWFGFECVRDVPGLPPEILMVPLAGHSRGHAGIAVQGDGGSWLLHAGDAYFYHGEMAAQPHCPALLKAVQVLDQVDAGARLANAARVRELARTRREVRVFCSHDPIELEQAQARARAEAPSAA